MRRPALLVLRHADAEVPAFGTSPPEHHDDHAIMVRGDRPPVTSSGDGRYRERMADPVLTYDTATPEQVTQARAEARRKLADAQARCTPEFWEQIRAKYGVQPVQQ